MFAKWIVCLIVANLTVLLLPEQHPLDVNRAT